MSNTVLAENLRLLLLLLVPFLPGGVCCAEQFNIADGDVAALKAAINRSNSNNKPDTIHLAPFGTYRFTSVDNTFLGDNALPIFIKDGSDANYLVILGNGATLMRDVSIAALRLLYFEDCKVAIYDANLVAGSTLYFSGQGGAIKSSSARITLQNCLLKDNRAAEGGGVYLVSGTLTTRNCTFTNNVATAGTGAALASFYGLTIMENCVVVNNRCLNVNTPAAIYNFIPLNSNTAMDNMYFKNCIIAKNTYDNATSPDNGKEFDLGGAVYTQGGNLVGSYPVVTQVVFPTFRQGEPSGNNDYVGTQTMPIDPLIGTLGDYGLFTNSYDLLSGSKALLIDAGIKGAGLPVVASNGVSPTEAYPGDIVTITGINLSGINKVQFPGAPTTTSRIVATNNTVTVPVHPNTTRGQILLIDAAPHFIFTNQVFKVKTAVTPSVPSNLIGLPVSTSEIMLTWNDVSNEDSYQVEYKKVQDITYTILAFVPVNSVNLLAEHLECSTDYNFRIIALGHGTQSLPSNVIDITPQQLQTPTITPPSSTRGCTGDSIALVAPHGFAGYIWSNNKSAQTITVETAGNYSVQVIDVSGCKSNFSSPVSIEFRDCPDLPIEPIITGIKERNINPVFPNPSDGRFTVDITDRYRLVVSDLVGRAIYQCQCAGNTQVDLSGSAPGTYLVIIESNDGVLTFLETITK